MGCLVNMSSVLYIHLLCISSFLCCVYTCSIIYLRCMHKYRKHIYYGILINDVDTNNFEKYIKIMY